MTRAFKILPEKESFLAGAEGRKNPSLPPVYARLPYIPPLTLYERLKGPGTILLESIKGPDNIARYSFIAFDPYLEFRVKNSVISLQGCNRSSLAGSRPLSQLRELVTAYPQEKNPDLPPFQGGCAGLFSYDFAHYLENLPVNTIDDLGIPDAHFHLFDRLFAFDHKLQQTYAIVCPGARGLLNSAIKREEQGGGVKRINSAYNEAEDALTNMLSTYSSSAKDTGDGVVKIPGKKRQVRIAHEMSKSDYMSMVVRAKEYIRAGDIFQANLSQRLSAEIGDSSPWRLYMILRQINPAPFAAYADFGSYQIVSSSPERLIRLADGTAETRPIAGTRPRGATALEDERMRADLLLNAKERAEHIMLIDLERNDIGRVCSYGTVSVDELMITEDYSHVIHIVSNVRGNMAKGRDAFSLTRAAFPGGTITGVPKVRCMEIIDELEPVARGPYTGSLGYIGYNGEMDLNIIIRTFVIKDAVAYVQAGAGIVADSDPEREYYETLKKAEALISTLERL